MTHQPRRKPNPPRPGMLRFEVPIPPAVLAKYSPAEVARIVQADLEQAIEAAMKRYAEELDRQFIEGGP